MILKIAKDMKADDGIVINQDNNTLLTIIHFTFLGFSALPTPITEEVIICVVLTGKPTIVENNITAEAEIWEAKECTGWIVKSFLPTVLIIRYPPTDMPMAIINPQETLT